MIFTIDGLKSNISVVAEKYKLCRSVKRAIASVEIEGYKLDEEQKAFCLEFVSGNMKKEEFINTMLERHRA